MHWHAHQTACRLGRYWAINWIASACSFAAASAAMYSLGDISSRRSCRAGSLGLNRRQMSAARTGTAVGLALVAIFASLIDHRHAALDLYHAVAIDLHDGAVRLVDDLGVGRDHQTFKRDSRLVDGDAV